MPEVTIYWIDYLGLKFNRKSDRDWTFWMLYVAKSHDRGISNTVMSTHRGI